MFAFVNTIGLVRGRIYCRWPVVVIFKCDREFAGELGERELDIGSTHYGYFLFSETKRRAEEVSEFQKKKGTTCTV